MNEKLVDLVIDSVAQEKEIPCFIVSLHWWKDLIVQSLEPRFGVKAVKQVFANWMELCPDKCEYDGRIRGGINGGLDKLDIVQHSIKPQLTQQEKVIYIGDSAIDLLSCLEVDVGILIDPGVETLQLCHLVRIDTVLVEELVEKGITIFKLLLNQRGDSDCTHPRIYLAKHWSSLHQFFGFSC